MLASCALDVKFHDWDTCDCLGSVAAPDPKSKGFFDLSWCNEGKHLAAVPCSGKSLIISVYQSSPSTHSVIKDDKWKPLKEIIDIPSVRTVSFSKTENTNIIVGTLNGEVLLYNIQNKKVVKAFPELPCSVNLLEYGAQDAFVAAGCSNGQIFIYGPAHNVSAALFVPYSETLSAIAVHQKQANLLAGGSEKGIVAIWDAHSGNNLLKSKNHCGSVMDMAFSIIDDSFTTIGFDQKINIYDLRTLECVHEKQFDTDLTALAYCPNGTDIAVATGRGQVICLDRRYLHSNKSGLKAHKGPIKRLSFDSSNLNSKSIPSNYLREETDILSEEILQCGLSNPTEVKTPASGDFNISKSKVRFGSGLYPNIDKLSVGTSRCQMGTCADKTTFHIIDEHSLNQLRDEIMRATKEIVNGIVETMNNEFLKMRMGVSREFCSMEIRNKKRWQDFNMILLKIGESNEDHQSFDDFPVKAPPSGSVHIMNKKNMD